MTNSILLCKRYFVPSSKCHNSPRSEWNAGMLSPPALRKRLGFPAEREPNIVPGRHELHEVPTTSAEPKLHL